MVIWGQSPEELIRPILFFMLISGSVYFEVLSPSPTSAMLLHLVAAAIALLIGVSILFSTCPAALRQVFPAQVDIGKCLRSALPLMVNSSSLVLNRYVDVVLLGILSTMIDTGIYRVAAQAAVMLSLGLQGLSMVVAPKISEYYASRNFEKLESIARLTSSLSFLIAFLLATVFFFLVNSY